MTQNQYEQLEGRAQLLKTRVFNLKDVSGTWMAQETIAVVIDEAREELTRIEKTLSTRREYTYNFEGGGWNSEYAYTVEEAKENAAKRWEGEKMQPRWDSFRICSEQEMQGLLSLFY